MNDLMRVHRTLCSAFVSEDLYRIALGGTRGDLGTIARYLQAPLHERPDISVYFDKDFYLAANPDVGLAGVDPLLHFIQTGVSERRSPHPLIDLRFIATEYPEVIGSGFTGDTIAELLEDDLICPAPYFDPAEYRARLGAAAPERAMLRHFLRSGLPQNILANPYLDPVWYAAQHADVPADPYHALRHFITEGDFSARPAGPHFDGRLYWARYPDVAAARTPPLLHYLLHGKAEGRQLPSERKAVRHRAGQAPPAGASGDAAVPDKAGAGSVFHEMRARLEDVRQAQKDGLLPVPPPMLRAGTIAGALRKLRFSQAKAPRLSIILPVFNEIDYTLECLLSVQRGQPAVSFEIILADDASTDPDAARLARIPGVVVLRQAENVGFIGNCNAAFAACRGEYVLLLNNDTQILGDAIDMLVAALDADPGLGAVGPKIVYPNGRLQEAGCFLRPNGESGMVGLFGDPNEGGFGRDRDVAYCSGAALMFRRSLVGPVLFDAVFRPAYCEDADLCLRLQAGGHRVGYVHRAVVVHHLSVSTNRNSLAAKLRTITRNQQTLCERWGELIRRIDKVRVLAFYLPQFHPTPENDLWWGKGFTEWTNVARARPSYVGHYQPHLPSDLGFYDLRNRASLAAQAHLAARYGIDGFCVYYYNFGSRRVLSTPLEIVRANPDIPFNWCLCWANENWTRHWDGGDREILLEQSYDTATLDSIIADAVIHAGDRRYLRVNDRPLFLVYRPLQLPDAPGFAAACRAAFVAAGFAGVHLVYVESMEAVDRGIRPADLGFDACVEFPPHGRAAPAATGAEIVKDGWSGYRYDYPETVIEFLKRDSVPYARYPAVFPSWDNTPRQPIRGTSFDAATPEAFRFYVEEKVEEIRQFLMGDERLLFVNAWNEWAEGAHLEPDSQHGHGWLEALRDALARKRCA